MVAILRQQLRLYLVLDPDMVAGDLLDTVRASLQAGTTMLQLRAKHRSDRDILEMARPLRILCREAGIPFIVNDRLDLALACEADGVHLGVDDLPLKVARKLGGPDLIVGYSPESDEQIATAAEAGASYLGIGPVFATGTKIDAGEAIGTAECHRRTSLGGMPCVGIGGITSANAASVIATGADGVAVVAAILRSRDPAQATTDLLQALNGAPRG